MRRACAGLLAVASILAVALASARLLHEDEARAASGRGTHARGGAHEAGEPATVADQATLAALAKDLGQLRAELEATKARLAERDGQVLELRIFVEHLAAERGLSGLTAPIRSSCDVVLASVPSPEPATFGPNLPATELGFGLGDPRAIVLARLGAPEHDDDEGTEGSVVTCDYYKLGLNVVLDERKLVSSIEVFGAPTLCSSSGFEGVGEVARPWFRRSPFAVRGVAIGTSVEEAVARLGPPTSAHDSETDPRLVYDNGQLVVYLTGAPPRTVRGIRLERAR